MADNAKPGCAAYGEISGKPLTGKPLMGWDTCAPRLCFAPTDCLPAWRREPWTRKDGIACTLRLKKA
jgi:hypothetical protein